MADEADDRRVRVAKLIADRGVASRRRAEELIAEGKVTLNGEVLKTPAVLVDPAHDHVRVEGRPLPAAPRRRYLLMFKPKGMLTTTSDPQGRRTVMELLGDLAERVDPVGRLDFNTEGALLFTNDGDLANRLLHPKTRVPKRYLAKVYRTPSERDLALIEKGVHLEEGRTQPAKARVVERTDNENCWVEITVTEGRNRLVRRMLAQIGHPVSKLRRESFATISIRGMERGQVRELTEDEVRRLKDIASGKRPARAGQRSRGKGFARPKPKTRRPGRRRSGR